MRVLLTSIGSSGDINPFLALGRALVERGHEVTFLVNPFFEAQAREAGLAYEPLGDLLAPHEFARDHPQSFSRFGGPFHLIRMWLAPMARVIYERTRDVIASARPDVVVGHQISFGAPWAAAERGVPFVTCVLAPATTLSVHSPSVYQTGHDVTGYPLWYRRFYSWLSRSIMRMLLDGPVNEVRAAAGVPAVRDTFFGEMMGQRATLGLWSPALRGPQPDDPAHFHVCGFPWHDRSTRYGERGRGLDARLERFLEHPEPPIVFTLGSVISHVGHREFSAAAGACRVLGRRGVLVTGSDDSVPADLPTGVIAVDYVPYSLLMPRGCATVHHGGIGTTAQSLRAGKPVVIIPHAHDQFDNAARVQRAGAGVWLPRRKATPRGLAQTLRALLEDRSVRDAAALIGAQVAAEDGAQRAAQRIEACIK